MDKLTKAIRRALAKNATQTREVLRGTYSQPFGLASGLVTVGRCDQEILASRGPNHDKGSAVTVVSGGGTTAILPGPATAGPGPSSTATLALAGAAYAGGHGDFAVRAYSRSGTNGKLFEGVLNIPGHTLAMNSTAVKTFAWPVGWGGSGGIIQLPDGGEGVGINSFASISVAAGTRFMFYDGVLEATANAPLIAGLRRYNAPVPYPADGVWRAVLKETSGNPGEHATVATLPLDMSTAWVEGADTTAIGAPPRAFMCNIGFEDQAVVCPMYEAGLTEPTTCFVFPGGGGAVYEASWAGLFTTGLTGTHGEPYGSNSWRTGATISPGYTEVGTWPELTIGAPSWSEFPDGSGRLLVAQSSGPFNSVTLANRGGVFFTGLAISWTSTAFDIDAVWVIREA